MLFCGLDSRTSSMVLERDFIPVTGLRVGCISLSRSLSGVRERHTEREEEIQVN